MASSPLVERLHRRANAGVAMRARSDRDERVRALRLPAVSTPRAAMELHTASDDSHARAEECRGQRVSLEAGERAAIKRKIHRPRAVDLRATLNAEGAGGHQRVPVAIEVASARTRWEKAAPGLAAPVPSGDACVKALALVAGRGSVARYTVRNWCVAVFRTALNHCPHPRVCRHRSACTPFTLLRKKRYSAHHSSLTSRAGRARCASPP